MTMMMMMVMTISLDDMPQDCEIFKNHTDTKEMVIQAHLSNEIHTEHTGILR